MDGQGRSLYLFKADKGSTSKCSGACAQAWPPMTSGSKPKAAHGVQASMLGTSKRGDGTSQVTYAGHPLYRYAGDQSPGDTPVSRTPTFGASGTC